MTIFVVDNIQFLKKYKVFEKEEQKRAKKAPTRSQEEDSDIEKTDSDEEFRNEKDISKDLFMKVIFLQEKLDDPEIVFGKFVNELRKNETFYQKFLDSLPFFYRERVLFLKDVEKVVIDVERGITENRRILKIKRK